jgi:IPT/TIG domain
MKNFLNNRYDGALSIETNKSLKASIIILTVSILSLLFLNSCKKTEEAVIDETGPFIESVNPAAGYAGTEVTITGRNFGSLKEVDAVTFDGIKATVKLFQVPNLKLLPLHTNLGK